MFELFAYNDYINLWYCMNPKINHTPSHPFYGLYKPSGDIERASVHGWEIHRFYMGPSWEHDL